MYIVKINGKSYKLKERWDEMTTTEAIEIMKVIKDMPKRLMDYYNLILKQQTKQVEIELDKWHKLLKVEETKKEFPMFYGKVLKLLSNVPQKVIDRTDWQSRTNVYLFKIDEGISCESVVIGLLSFPYDYTIKNIASFKLGEEVLILPKIKSILGVDKPMAGEQAIVFTESADLEIFSEKLAGGVYEYANNIIAILCRPEGEEYDEEKSLVRAEKMKDLTMDIFWEVFFCIEKQRAILKRDMVICLVGEELKAKRQLLKVA